MLNKNMNNDQYTIHYYPPAYRQGYNSYISWLYNGGERPINPYDSDDDTQMYEYAQWNKGWEDASIDST